MKTLIAPTEDFIKTERTKLAADVSAGSNVTLTLENNDGMAQNTYIVIGREGSEKAELQQINAAVSGATDVQVATLKFAHKAGEQVTVYRYNQRKFYGSETATGTYTELTDDGSPVTMQVDDPQGTKIEYTDTVYSYFKATYYNSTTTEETSESDASATLADETARYTSIHAIKVQAGLTQNPYITDDRIERKRKQAENEINSHIFTRYTLPLTEIPELIKNICTLLAAGYIDFEEFGPEGEGKKWLGEARGMLKAIQDGRQRLIGEDGTEIAHSTTKNQLQGYPDNDGTSDSDTPQSMFQIDQEF